MEDLNAALCRVYAEAEQHLGFTRRIPDADAADQLGQLGVDEQTPAIVSVLESVEALSDFTFSNDHGACFTNRSNWFETVTAPQLVLWGVPSETHPKSFAD